MTYRKNQGELVGCSTVQIDRAEIREMDDAGRRALVTVGRDEVERVSLRRGQLAERPLAQIALGLCVAALGVPGMLACFSEMRFQKWFTSAIALPIGLWIVAATFKRGTYLLVEARSGARKLVMRDRVSPAQLSAFVEQARGVGVEIDASAALPPGS